MTENVWQCKFLTTEIFDDRNFIHIISIADTAPTMQSGKKRTFTVTTHGIPKCKPQDHIFKCEQCGEKFNKYELMKNSQKISCPSQWSG